MCFFTIRRTFFTCRCQQDAPAVLTQCQEFQDWLAAMTKWDHCDRKGPEPANRCRGKKMYFMNEENCGACNGRVKTCQMRKC